MGPVYPRIGLLGSQEMELSEEVTQKDISPHVESSLTNEHAGSSVTLLPHVLPRLPSLAPRCSGNLLLLDVHFFVSMFARVMRILECVLAVLLELHGGRGARCVSVPPVSDTAYFAIRHIGELSKFSYSDSTASVEEDYGSDYGRYDGTQY